MNVISIFYDFSQAPELIKYSFIEKGLSEYKVDPKAAADFLRTVFEHKPNVRLKAKAYCATVGTEYDGRSTELASGIINSLVSDGKVDISRWKRISGVNLEAYELASSSGS